VTAADAVTLSGLFSRISTSTAGPGTAGISQSHPTPSPCRIKLPFTQTLSGAGQGRHWINVTSLNMSGGSRISSSTYDSTGTAAM